VGPVQWLVASLGLAAIWGVMVRGSAGLDRKQMIKYQVTDGYKAYVESTPPLLPFTAASDYDALRAEVGPSLRFHPERLLQQAVCWKRHPTAQGPLRCRVVPES
jgi:hypothetical protein